MIFNKNAPGKRAVSAFFQYGRKMMQKLSAMGFLVVNRVRIDYNNK